LENDSLAHFDGMVGESFIKPAEQRHVHGGGHPVLPLAVHQHRKQVSMKVVHRVVFVVNARGLLWVT
jgi:hypothetical protein